MVKHSTCQVYKEMEDRGWAPGELGMLSQILLLPPGLLGQGSSH